MKIQLLLLITLLFFYSYGQNDTPSIVIFEKASGKMKNNYTKNQILKTPIQLIFKKDYKDDQIEIINSFKKNIGSGKFGSDGLQPIYGTNGDYRIDIKLNTENKLSLIQFAENAPTDKDTIALKIKIGSFVTEIKYTHKTDTVPDKSDKNDTEVPYQPGMLYYDAMTLASNAGSDTKLKILDAYEVDTSNPYLKDLCKALGKEHSYAEGVGAVSLISSIGGADVTNFAAGLARFLAERAKEELNDAFFKKMEQQLNAYPELTTVFPQTSNILKTIKDYSYSSVLQVLKEAFETDMQNLPENIYLIKDLDPSNCSSLEKCTCKNNAKCKENAICDGCPKCRCEARLGKISNFFNGLNGQWVIAGMLTVKEAIQSTNPSDLIKTISESTELSDVKSTSVEDKNFDSYNIVSSIELTNFISQSLLSKEEGQVWINSTEFNALFKTKDAFPIYLGLLLASQNISEKEIDFYKSDNKDKISFGEVLIQAYNIQEKLKTLIKTTYLGFNSANSAVKKMVEASSNSIEAEPQTLYDYYRTFTSSLKQIASNPLIQTLTGRDLGAEYLKISQFLDPAVDMAYHISTKKYSSALYDASLLLDNIDAPVFEKPIAKSFIKYGTLISTVASAQSSDEVKKAIEASVLPAGSSAVKRKTRGSISINGYVGAFGGVAWTKTRTTELNTSTNTMDTVSRSVSYGTYGLYAPVGLSFNLGDLGSKKKNGLTLGVQIIDLGALVNLYATKGDKAALPTDFKVRLSDILSPGIQIGYNVPNSPLTLMVGTQYVPALNNISQITSSEPFSPIALRAQLGIVVDIPLYNLKVWDSKK